MPEVGGAGSVHAKGACAPAEADQGWVESEILRFGRTPIQFNATYFLTNDYLS